MQLQDFFMLMGVGGLFIILGIGSVIWGVVEEKHYYNALAEKPGDIREFLDRSPHHPQPAALRIGGWIAIAVGVVLLAVGFALWFRVRG